MKASEFCFWLQGYFEIRNAVSLFDPIVTNEQAEIIQRHLALVFKHDREQWRHAQIPMCMYCDARRDWLPLSVHEIERRSHSTKRWASLSNLLLLCCHCHMTDFATMAHAKQLAVKYLKDRVHYDLNAWLRLRDPGLVAPNRVTQDEVDYWVVTLSKEWAG